MSVYVINSAVFDDKNNSISIVDKMTVSIIIINSTFRNTKQLTLAKDLMFLSSIVFEKCKFETDYLYHSCVNCPNLSRVIVKESFNRPNVESMNYITPTINNNNSNSNLYRQRLRVII